ncbi:aminoglycoside phosphotransferase family protein [Nocardioides KLBMP 9356]|uniref:Aminoglycoside phosphotransferase family protein n=1 Tax=Nocardioides potassii TaxID=2911371 RepID=A0ABS9H6Y7_9ACTN|nr:phosphotransferase [Nocardioides potassii]MCF6376972.1 aminoglycoside phosphotransferase family protein [Nocardioides potassii]
MKATFASDGPTGVHERAPLGADDVGDDELAAMVADLWRVPSVELVDSAAEVVDYHVPSILTGARTWVRGRADAGDGPRAFTLFVKRVHHWRHSPAFAFVPPELGEWAAASVPWRAEPLLYASDLAERLPEGLTMPRAVRVDERPDETAVIWMEAVEASGEPWTRETYVEAAGLLGRLSGSPRVDELAGIDPLPWHVQSFIHGRVAHTVLPGLLDDATWRHELVAPCFGDLRGRLTAVADHLDALGEEFARMPHRAAHGDACPNNLLRHASGGGFTLIDFGFWRPQPVGYDLSQLLVGDIQIGQRDAADLPELAEACLTSYGAGLAAEGVEVPDDVLRRCHAVSLALFNGLPSLPMEHLGEEPTAALHDWALQRSRIARYALDVLERTEA